MMRKVLVKKEINGEEKWVEEWKDEGISRYDYNSFGAHVNHGINSK